LKSIQGVVTLPALCKLSIPMICYEDYDTFYTIGGIHDDKRLSVMLTKLLKVALLLEEVEI